MLDDIRLCVSEAISNVVTHAYRGHVEPGTVAMTLELDDRELTIKVIDVGSGLRARTDSPGIGLGLVIIAAAADNVSIRAAPADGTEMCMSFLRPKRRARATGGLRAGSAVEVRGPDPA